MNKTKEALCQELFALKKDYAELKEMYEKELKRDPKNTPPDEEALQQANRELEAIITASPDGIGITSLEGVLLFASDKLLQMYDYSVDERDAILGRPVFDYIDPSNHIYLKENIRKLITGETDNEIREYMGLKKDGSRIFVELNYTLLRNSSGHPERIMVIQRDCTERKRIQEETRKMNLKLAESNATKDRFFSIIAHDLKSPFQGLLGYSEILSSEYNTLSEDEKLSFISTIEELSRNSYKLLENLLEWSRIQTGKMTANPEEFNLLIELYPTISLLKQTASNKNIWFNYKIDKSLVINADKNMLSSIIRNLVANSIKFTNPGGRITLSATKADGFTKFLVADTGIGMSEEIIDDLFKMGKSVSRRGTANEEGTGLGLLLCKEMVEKHGGRIWVESELGKGSSFSFTIKDPL
ncbi:MAG: PAS domain S-box protein [Ignavibacteria bacterium]|jgi:PAS domain S-box-containing protein|nr:PAS domain S-box protein [Ignavibacteria bacterium]MCU7502254.1 PAS domain S-box protein [Ignavibacteria bacterium]MCU7516702.1 PAS domain S-box protein [Ignavibacteria bacterium]